MQVIGANVLVLAYSLSSQIWSTKVSIQFLPPYLPSQEEKDDPQLFADNVRQVGTEEPLLSSQWQLLIFKVVVLYIHYFDIETQACIISDSF